MDSNFNENLYRKKLIKSKSGLRIVLINEKYSSPFLLCEPYWVPDNEITHCTSCEGKFNFTKRKHHCRRCGRIYCSSCTCSKILLPRMSFVDPVRVCVKCAHITEQENNFFNKRIKILTNGATFLLSPLRESDTTCLCLCKLSLDHKYLEFDTVANLPPLPIESVTNFNITHDKGSSYIEISYENGGFRLSTGPETTKPQALEWIEAMNEAFKLIDVSSVIKISEKVKNKKQNKKGSKFYGISNCKDEKKEKSKPKKTYKKNQFNVFNVDMQIWIVGIIRVKLKSIQSVESL